LFGLEPADLGKQTIMLSGSCANMRRLLDRLPWEIHEASDRKGDVLAIEATPRGIALRQIKRSA